MSRARFAIRFPARVQFDIGGDEMPSARDDALAPVRTKKRQKGLRRSWSGKAQECARGPAATSAGALDDLFLRIELAVLAGVVQRHVEIDALVERIDFAAIERPRVHVDTHGAARKLAQVEHLVDRLEGIDGGGVLRV